MKALGRYLIAVLGAVALAAALILVVTGWAGRTTILASAGTVVVVQGLSFMVTRAFRDQHMMLAWGLGSAVRFVALVLYALVVARLWRASITPALLSFAAFLFVTTLFEPVFLKR